MKKTIYHWRPAMENIIKKQIVETSMSLEEYIPLKVLIDRKDEPTRYLSYSKDKTSLLEIAIVITSGFIKRCCTTIF